MDTPRTLRTTLAVALTGASAALFGLAGVFLYLDPQIPKAESYRHIHLQTPLRVRAVDGSLMATFGERRRIPLEMEEFPEPFVRAVLDTEAKRFYAHGGIDFIPLLRSTIALLLDPDEIPPGASTITMQLARNISFTLEQTFLRKFKEMLLALKIEQELTKDEILELYLNLVPFGQRAYGAEAAARTYYGTPLAELDLAQWAMLAGIPQAPSIGNPVSGPERALERRNLVLRNMYRQGSIDRPALEAALAASITARLHQPTPEVEAPWVAEEVRQMAIRRYGPEIYERGYEITTTVDPEMQAAANDALRRGLEAYTVRHGYRGPERILEAPEEDAALDENTRERWRQTLRETRRYGGQEPALVTRVEAERFHALLADGREISVPAQGWRWARPYLSANARGAVPQRAADVVARGHLVRVQPDPELGWRLGQVPRVQGALIAMDPDDGSIRAMVGGYDFRLSQYNHATQAERQPGSNFKPFIYAAGLHAGLTPASIFNDAPLVFDDVNLEGTYRPRNYGGQFRGPTRLRTALYRSINLVSMRVLLSVGVAEAIEYVERFGFDTSSFPRNLQLAVGGGTMALTPQALARGFATFANGGFRVDPHLLTRIERVGDGVIARPLASVACARCESDDARGLPSPVELDAPRRRPTDGASHAVPRAPTPDADAAATEPSNPNIDRRVELAPRVLEPRLAYIMDSMLSDVIQRGTGRRARVLERDDLAGKTGTTNAADTWFSGYTPGLAATVWMGFADNRPLGDNEVGANGPLPIWIDFMDVALDKVPPRELPQPSGLIEVRIDPATGRLARPGQDDAIFEILRAENIPGDAASTAGGEGEASSPRPEEIF